MFSKDLYCRHVKTRFCLGKSLRCVLIFNPLCQFWWDLLDNINLKITTTLYLGHVSRLRIHSGFLCHCYTYVLLPCFIGPRWASWNLGIFLCIRCAGIHRNLGVHISKVKSVNLDTWTPEQIAVSWNWTCLWIDIDWEEMQKWSSNFDKLFAALQQNKWSWLGFLFTNHS